MKASFTIPGRRQLDAHPNRDVGHSVEALAGGNHIQSPHSGLAADVHVSLRTFADGTAFIDRDHNGAGSTGERFAAPTGTIERLTATASAPKPATRPAQPGQPAATAAPPPTQPTTPNRPSSPTACAAPPA